jgi:hypothetical protein
LAEAENTQTKRSRPSVSPVFIVVGLAVVVLAAAWHLFFRGGPPPPEKPLVTPEAKAYVRHLQLSDVEMRAKESYMKQAVVEITGKITNAGDRPLKIVEINCIFFDPYGLVVLRERVPIVSQKMGGLNSGQVKSFRLPFDNIPQSWNQALPQLVIARIVFG